MTPALSVSDHIKNLSDRISIEVDRLNHSTLQDCKPTDSLVFIGNWQDAIPRSIWTDASLSAMDVRSWGIMRTQAVQGSAVLLSINTLLKDSLGYSNASISRVLYVLRLRRWLSLCSTLRTKTGQFKGHVYAVHDAPVSLDDAIYLDTDYIAFVKKQTGHRNNSIRKLAQSIWINILEAIDQDTAFHYSPEAGIQGFLHQLINPATQNLKKIQLNPFYKLTPGTKSHVHFLNTVTNSQVQNLNTANKHKEIKENQSDSIHVQKLNVATLCSSSFFNNKTPTTDCNEMAQKPAQHVQTELIYPDVFNTSERKLATLYLQKIDTEFQQSFLDETAAQIQQRSQTSNPIRNPIGYLAWLCKEHNQGNTYLTSAYLKQQKERERKKSQEQQLKHQQQALTQAALTQSGTKTIGLNKKQHGDNPRETRTARKTTRWEGLEKSVRPKSRPENIEQ